MNKRIYILSPSDRFNYGDLLFSYILSYYLKRDNVEFIYCSTTKSDLSNLGGIKTHSFEKLYDLDSSFENYLIIAGGECLFAQWDILSFIDPSIDNLKRLLLKYRFLRIKDILKLISLVVKLKYRPKTKYPFTIARHELPAFRVILYNSVGGSYLKNNYKSLSKNDINIIKDCDYLSVRDAATQFGLSQLGVKCKIVADSAILMSSVFSEKFLNAKVQKIFLSLNEYIFFQINLSLWEKNKTILIGQLKKLNNELNKQFVLCPIGTALGHNDQIALSELYGELGNKISFFVSEPTIWDIMYLIKNSNLYIGSSLHGAITAMSYNIPFVTFGVNKVKEYIRYWIKDNPENHIAEIEEISEKSERALLLLNSCEAQKESVYSSLKIIANKINL